MPDGTNEVRSHARSLHVLLLEDEPPVATGLAALLEHEGHSVRIAESIAVATAELTRFVPDVIVADVHLPDGNGVEYCRLLRKSGAIHPTVFISGHADAETIAALEWPATGFLRKPFDFDELVALIERVVQEGHRFRPSE
jgi:two-component system response regulator HydG